MMPDHLRLDAVFGFRRFHLLQIGSLVVLVLSGCNSSSDKFDHSPSSSTGAAIDPQPAAEQTPTAKQAPTTEQTPAAKLSQAKAALIAQQPDQAMQLAQAVLVADPENVQAISIALEVHFRRQEHRSAAELAERLAALQPAQASDLLLRAYNWRMQSQDYQKAEENLRRGLEANPTTDLHRAMSYLLNAQGRRFEAAEHTRQLIRRNANSPLELMSLIDLSGPYELMAMEEPDPEESSSIFLLSTARRVFFKDRDHEKARQMVAKICQAHPDSAAAAALLGRILAEIGDPKALAEWAQDLPADIDRHPEYWLAIGSWLQNSGEHEQAVRAFGEALRRDPTDRQSLRWMIQSLDQINQSILAAGLRPKLGTLDEIFRNAMRADAKQSAEIAEQLMTLTRPWESSGWYEVTANKTGQIYELKDQLHARVQAIRQWEQSYDHDQDRIQKARLKSLLGFEIEKWPLPEIAAIAGRKSSDVPSPTVATDLRLNNVATNLGIETTLVSGLPPDDQPYYLYQTNGGGLAAADFDLDGRCDLYVVHSGGKPLAEPNSQPNQLYRQLPDQTFAEVTEHAGTGDRGFGQGVSAADINQDGFLDLLIANIGKNAIYLNQGDGTFRAAPDWLPTEPDQWSSHIAAGDLDGDALPDLVVANYIDDPDVLRNTCLGSQYAGGSIACAPHMHQAAADSIYTNSPNGRFKTWDDLKRNGKLPNWGFGIVIANIDREYGNDVFITNDGDLNHLWMSKPREENTTASQQFSLVESAGIRGCSIGYQGLSQACMGIASGDFDRNGYLDFHVTNYFNQSCNLYLQTKSGFFDDQAVKYRIKELSYSVLGFGTQAADLDNDGWQDLAVLNGHVHDDRPAGTPYQMEPQVMRGSPSGFLAQEPNQLGTYWSGKRLGRTLATWDWNRDGRIDLVANHLDDPIAVLQNDSETGNWLQLELVGVASEREAIGAEVVVTSGGETWTQWQLGGDGYMCSNEALLHIGVGNESHIPRVEIRWPSGTTQTLEDLEVNQRYLIVEDHDAFAR